MEKIPYDVILDVQRKVNIVDVISEYLPIEQKGKNYFAICPFHDDHNPSMSISPEKQIYTCFVCGASGNVFNFVMNYEKISFTEAVMKLAAKAGVSLNLKYESKKNNPEDKNDKFYKMFAVVNKYYQNNLRSVYGKSASEYLHNRGINDEVIKTFEIGLSLNDNNVNKLLTAKGYETSELVDIGLCGSKGNFVYDTFRNRIMFPLWSATGQVVGFSGRIYNGEAESKYTNSKESAIFKKGSLLYNYHRAMEYAREKRQIIIVEGFMDVIRLYTVGIKNVVATMGTAITKEHADLIRRLSKNVVLCFDGDKAGEKATVTALEALEKIGLNPKIIRLEDDFDPDDYVVKKGAEAFLNHLKNAMNAFDFKLIINKKQTNFNDYNEVSNYLKNAAKELEQINDKIVYELTVKRLAKETGVEESTINSLVSSAPKKTVRIIDKPRITARNKYVKAQEYLIYYMLRNVEAVLLYQNNVSYLPEQTLSQIALEILAFYEKNNYVNLTEFTLYLEDKTELINEVLRIDAYDLPEEMTTEQIKDYVKTIDEGILNQEIKKVKDQISKETNVAKKVVLLEKLASLKKKECIK